MTYTPPTPVQLREQRGTAAEKLSRELTKVSTEIGAIQTAAGLAQPKFITLTVDAGTNTAIATAGIDLASGSDIVTYAHFFPKAVTVIGMHDYLTEAYVKDTTDAKLEVYTEAGTPVKIFTRTLTAAGEAIRAAHTTAPESGKADLAAGTAIYLKAVNTGSSSGTGHALVVVEYVER